MSEQTLRIWTRVSAPFRIAGRYRLIATVVPVDGPHDIGHGFQAYTVTSPKGHKYIAEANTGGLQGSSLEDLRRAVEACSREEILDQLTDAAGHARVAEDLPLEEFWSHFRSEREKN